MSKFNPFDSSGRLSRLQYAGYLVIWVLVFVAVALTFVPRESFAADLGFGVIEIALNIIFMVATLSYGVRRLHDFDANGWWYLIVLIPIANVILGLLLLRLPPTPGPNRYGLPRSNSDAGTG